MVHVNRLDGCLLPCANSSLQHTLPKVCVRGAGVPISSSVLRNIAGPPDLHGGD